MDDGRFPSSRENPRGFPADRPPRPSPPESRPAPSVLLDRFRAMVRLREEELRGGEEDEDELSPTLTTAEIVQLYEEVLGELMFNSKPIITELTMIAGDHREHAEGIADAICSRILKVPVDHKLPSLYLLDSIVKNIGREYVRHFAPRLPKVFCEAYNEVNSSLRPAMRHLFGTWSQVFHPSVLRQIEDELHFSTPLNQRSTSLADRHSESPSPRPSHGIHVNPKYLEARRQLEHSAAMHVMGSHIDVDTVDIEGEQIGRKASENPRGRVGASPEFHDVQHLREVSSSLQVYGHRSSNQYGEYDFDHNEVLPSRREIARSGSPRTASVRASSMVGDEATLPHLKSRGSRPSSPPRVGLRRSISPVDDRFQTDISPGRVERTPPSHSGFGQGRLTDQNDWSERRWHTDEGAQQRESSIGYNLSNGHTKERTRELIDAYGSYRETYDFHEKHPKVQRLDVNGLSSEATTRNWQSSEEEEYIWEDMSPTLADQSNRNRLQPFGSFNGRPAINRSDDRPLEPDFRRVNWRDQASRPPVDDDRIPPLSSDHGSMSKKYLDIGGSRNDSLLHYHSASHLQEPRKFPYIFSPYSHQILSPRTIPSPGQTFPGPNDNFPDADIPFRRLPNIHTGNLNVDTPAIGRHFTHRPYSPPRAPPPIHPQLKHHQLPLLPLPPTQKQFRNSYDFTEGSKPVISQGPNSSLPFTWQQYDASDKKSSTFTKPLQLPYPPYQHPGSQELSTTRVQSQEGHGSFISRAQPQLFSHMPQPLNHVLTQGQGVVVASGFPNTLSGLPSSVGMQSMPDTTLHVRGGVLPPLPPGPPPPSQPGSSIISSSPASAFSGLIGTLMAQGLISLAPPGQSQVPHSDSVGVEFNVELLKVRHESAIKALYSDLPRQCTTCGLRFKCQEEHSCHMDWHVTKNRISKNRKQKPSRKWFVSAKEWLSGAEILGTDVVPGFLPTEAVAEKKEDKEMAVPADEDQNMCALCGELFEDFYSDETEEWMYKGAVYMNTPNGNIEGLDRSQFGPIVHVKCRSESAEDIG